MEQWKAVMLPEVCTRSLAGLLLLVSSLLSSAAGSGHFVDLAVLSWLARQLHGLHACPWLESPPEMSHLPAVISQIYNHVWSCLSPCLALELEPL